MAETNLAAWPSTVPLPPAPGEGPSRVRVDNTGPWPGVLIETGGGWVNLHSRRDPIGEADQWIERAAVTDSSTLFVVGLGLGYVLDALERRAWAGRVVVLEPEAALLPAWLARRDWRPWLSTGRLSILAGPDYAGASRVGPGIEPDREHPVVVVHPVLARSQPAGVERARETAARIWFGALSNREARRQNAGRYLINTLRNLTRIAAGGDVAHLTASATNMPAIVVAAGPSLDRNLPALGELAGRALILAVDTAARPLMASGIVPNVIVSVDPSEVNARHLTELPCANECALVAEASIDPAALESFGRQTFFGRVSRHHPWPWLESIGMPRGSMQAWGSVLTTTLDLAIRMGCNPIVFAGADLAYTEGRPYARGTTFEEDWKRQAAWGDCLDDLWTRAVQRPDSLEVEGLGGGPVRTAPHLVAFRDWVVEEAGRHPDRQFINATEAGILCGGCITQSNLRAVSGRLPQQSRDVARLISASYRPQAGAAQTVEQAVSRLAAEGFDASKEPLAGWIAFAERDGVLQEIVRTLGDEFKPRRRVRAAATEPAAPADDHLEIPATVESAPAPVHSDPLDAAATAAGLPCDGLQKALSTADRGAIAALVRERQPRVIVDRGTSHGLAGLAALDAAASGARLWSTHADEHFRALAAHLNLTSRIAGASDAPAADLVLLPLNDHASDGVDDVRHALDLLAAGGALIIVDEVGTAARARLHRAVYPVLETRPDLWVSDRRFVDHTTRLMVVFTDRLERLPDPAQADARKWDDGYRAAARRLVPAIVKALGPTSVRDIGCGAGYWLEAFAATGVTDCDGVTSDPIRDVLPAVATAVTRGPLEAIPQPAHRRDVCLCLEVLQRVPPDTQDAVVAACVASADVVVFSSTPPGWAGGDPGDRPLAYWASKFLHHGYVLDDSLRASIEGHWGFPAHVTDGLIVFRRQFAPGELPREVEAGFRDTLLNQARRSEDLYLQGMWWQVALMAARKDAAALARPVPAPHATPRVDPARLRVPSHRLLRGSHGTRQFRLRTDAARWFVTHPKQAITLEEDGRQLPRFNTNAEAAASPGGGWTLWRDEISVVASDGTDPRTNGRVYDLLVPPHVAWAEQQMFDDVRRMGL
jgi:SAM-dependent methyltransferase/predicted O-methyltransferase YrrM